MAVMEMITTETLMNYLYERRAPNLPASALANIISLLLWSLDDEGASTLALRTKWLESDEHDKVQIALSVQDVFPCKTRDEMIVLFDRITNRWPDLKLICSSLIEQWDLQVERRMKNR